MKPIPGKGVRFFAAQGRRGGLKRARSLSPLERAAIAFKAAQARWQGVSGPFAPSSVRLNQPRFDDPVYLEEILADGSLESWREIYRRVAEQPFGPSADALEKVLASAEIYGVVPLWKGLLRSVRGSP